jgi:hypothetical protein
MTRSVTGRQTTNSVTRDDGFVSVIEPAGWYEGKTAAACAAWSEALEKLPLGASATGTVVATAAFGVFVDLEAVPGAMALFDLVTWPHDRSLPAIGTRLQGRVVGHRPGHGDHPGQLRLAPLAEAQSSADTA